MDNRIGQLVREGETIYYVHLGPTRKYFEHQDVAACEFQLEVSDRQMAQTPDSPDYIDYAAWIIRKCEALRVALRQIERLGTEGSSDDFTIRYAMRDVARAALR